MHIKSVGRFIHRGCDENDGLIIGAAFKGNPFKPNTVYEIVDVLGELVIREVGESFILGKNDKPPYPRYGDTWGSSVDQILSAHGKYLMLTRIEYMQQQIVEHREFLVRKYDEAQVAKWESEGRDLSEIHD